ncbi:MAG: hypothetical protein ACTSYR_06245, partial [Candidatus Odinarchaeia archaeon]
TLGGFHLVISILTFASSLIAGFIWETIAPVTIFTYSLILTITATLLLYLFNPKKQFEEDD